MGNKPRKRPVVRRDGRTLKRDARSPGEATAAQLHGLWNWSLGPPLLFAFVIAATFADAFDGELVLDNFSKISGDSRIQAPTLENIRLILTRNYWWPTYESDLYRPLTTLSYWFDYSILRNGIHPLGYHLVNTFLHWLNACLVFRLTSRFLQHRPVALLVTLIFAVHPLTIEAVTNIIGRADLLAGLFMLVGLELHSRLRAGTCERPAWSRAALAACAILAAFSKESGVVLVALVVLDDLANLPPSADGPWATIRSWFKFMRWKNYLCVLPGLLLLLAARYELLKHSPVSHQMATDNPMVVSGFWTREMTAVKVLGYYLDLTFWPAKLSCDYSYNQIPVFGWTASGADLDAWIGLAMVIALAVAALIAWRRLPAVFFFLGFAWITLLPVSNLVIVIGTIMAERFMYLPVIGIVGALAAVGERLLSGSLLAPIARSRGARRVGVAAAMAVVVALATRTAIRNLDWHDNVRLWESALRTCPNSFKVYKGLATSLVADPAQLDECIRLAKHALQICDEHTFPIEHSPNGLISDLARYYFMKGEIVRLQTAAPQAAAAWYAKAEAMLDRAVRVDQAVNAVARRDSLKRGIRPEDYHDVGLSLVYDLRSQVFQRQGRFAKAEEACRWAIRLDPTRGYAYLRWAEVCAAAGQVDAAADHCLQSLKLGYREPSLLHALDQIFAVLMPGRSIWRQGTSGAEGFELNTDLPPVRQHLNRAMHELVETLIECRRRGEAETIREIAVEQWGCPAELFDDLPNQ